MHQSLHQAYHLYDVLNQFRNTYQQFGGGQEVESYPGAYEEVICVGATNAAKQKADYSNYGAWVDIVAPVGNEATSDTDIISTVPPDGYGMSYGTSFACPQVSAVIALMRSLNYSLTVDEIKDILYRSASDLGDPGKDIYYGHGLLNASKAVLAVLYPWILDSPTTDTSYYFIYPVLTIVFISIYYVFRRKKTRV